MARRMHPALSRGSRVLAGMGFWIAGVGAAVGALETSAGTMSTKVAMYRAEMDASQAQLTQLENKLDGQYTQLWIYVGSAALCFGLGARMTRDMGQLWSGPIYGQEPAAAPPPVAVEAVPGGVTPDNVIHVDFGGQAA